MFREYNLKHSVSKPYEKIRPWGADFRVTKSKFYDEDIFLIGYTDNPNTLTEEELIKVNIGVEEVLKDFDKRLQRYWKRYKENITTRRTTN